MIAYLVWDPDPALFRFDLPLLGRPLLWYGFLFALGFFLGYWVLTRLVRRYFAFSRGIALRDFRSRPDLLQQVRAFSEGLSFYVVVGVLIGARLGDVLFYQDWSEIARRPLSVIAVWEGGLASHGGAVGMLIALWLFARKQKMGFWTLVDLTVPSVSLAAVCIRIGNFINQEILGTVTEVPWAVLFLHPADGGALLPRHPVQLYEGFVYLILFFFTLSLRRLSLKPGGLTGLFLVLVFGSRFVLEWFKMEQSVSIAPGSPLTMGQWLSIPFVFLGAWLLCRRSPPNLSN
jgi:phosphatidylglycerol:prolipoprotein diacylglycerol transferase